MHYHQLLLYCIVGFAIDLDLTMVSGDASNISGDQWVLICSYSRSTGEVAGALSAIFLFCCDSGVKLMSFVIAGLGYYMINSWLAGRVRCTDTPLSVLLSFLFFPSVFLFCYIFAVRTVGVVHFIALKCSTIKSS